jgi:hypothetical protein
MSSGRYRTITTLGGVILTAATVAAVSTAAAGGSFLEDVDVIHHLRGDDRSGFFGWAVAELDDVDADGVTDVIVSDPTRATGGAVYVFSGATGVERFRVERPAPNLYGYSIADAGDTDGDGTSDVLVGDLTGAVELLSGVDGSLLHRFVHEPGDGLGAAVASAGDVDADGRPDLLLGARTASTAAGAGAGRVYVHSGDDYTSIRTYDGIQPGGLLGSGLDLTGDLDGDGRRDHVVGARDAGPKRNGQVLTFSGATGDPLWSFDAARRTGEELGSFFVAGLDDIDHDGTPDVYAADYADRSRGQGTGRAFVLSGIDGTPIHSWVGDRNKEGMGPGREAGDVDGDGVQDVAVGHYLSSDGAIAAGKLVIFSGESGKAITTATSTTARENFGFDAVGIGDIDADGVPDVVVSAASGQSVYIISSRVSS